MSIFIKFEKPHFGPRLVHMIQKNFKTRLFPEKNHLGLFQSCVTVSSCKKSMSGFFIELEKLHFKPQKDNFSKKNLD